MITNSRPAGRNSQFGFDHCSSQLLCYWRVADQLPTPPFGRHDPAVSKYVPVKKVKVRFAVPVKVTIFCSCVNWRVKFSPCTVPDTIMAVATPQPTPFPLNKACPVIALPFCVRLAVARITSDPLVVNLKNQVPVRAALCILQPPRKLKMRAAVIRTMFLIPSEISVPAYRRATQLVNSFPVIIGKC